MLVISTQNKSRSKRICLVLCIRPNISRRKLYKCIYVYKTCTVCLSFLTQHIHIHIPESHAVECSFKHKYIYLQKNDTFTTHRDIYSAAPPPSLLWRNHRRPAMQHATAPSAQLRAFQLMRGSVLCCGGGGCNKSHLASCITCILHCTAQ